MNNAARIVYRYLAVLFLAGVVVRFFLAALGVFPTQHEATKTGTTLTMTAFDHRFDPHIVRGDVLAVISIVLVATAFAARLGRSERRMTLALVLLW